MNRSSLQQFLDNAFGALRQDGRFTFNPPPWMSSVGTPVFWNTLMILAAVALVIFVYRKDGRRPIPRIVLGFIRVVVLAFVVLLINRPVWRVEDKRVLPSVVAILIDDSSSMNLRDTDDVAELALSKSPLSTTRPTTAPATNPSTAPTTDPAAALAAATLAATTGPATNPADPETEALVQGTGPTRLDIAQGLLLTGDQKALLRQLAAKHTLRIYRFNKDASQIGVVPPPGADGQAAPIDPSLVDAVRELAPKGAETQLVQSLNTAMNDLQGQRLAGVVVITDARETPESTPEQIKRLTDRKVDVYGVLLGKTEATVKNLAITALDMQDSAFKDDIVQARVAVQTTGYADPDDKTKTKQVRVKLTDKKGNPLRTEDGKEAEGTVDLAGDARGIIEIPFQTTEVGNIDVVATIEAEPNELQRRDNKAEATVSVLDAKINVLYVEGYPRWEYRYIKNEMIRDKSINISCLLLSADPNFPQEADPPVPPADEPFEGGLKRGAKFPGPITRFPESAADLRRWDVVIFGDVDPRQFTADQLKLVHDFVSIEAGGFGMIAGPQHAPRKYKGESSIEPLLPVQLTNARTVAEESKAFESGFRPVLTDEGRRGEAATIFRFFPDRQRNDKFLREEIQPLFWYYWGVTAPSGLSRVYLEHPTATDPSGRKAPLLVLGRFGAGPTLFSAIDDSWRWRFYTGESVFDTYWVQQIRYLGRGRKLAERGFRFTTSTQVVERGKSIRVDLSVIDPQMQEQLRGKGPVKVDVVDENGQVVRTVELTLNNAPPPDGTTPATGPMTPIRSTALYSADIDIPDPNGTYRIRLQKMLPKFENVERSYRVELPQMEFQDTTAHRQGLERLTQAPETALAAGSPAPSTRPAATARATNAASRVMSALDAQLRLASMIPDKSTTVVQPQDTPLWDKWPMLAIFMLLLTSEWVLRKVFGML